MGAYGPKTAMPRILRLMDRYDLKVGFYVPGWIIERYPAVVEDIVARGHEVGHHGYLHEKPFFLKGPEEEAARHPPPRLAHAFGGSEQAHLRPAEEARARLPYEHDGQRSAVPPCDAA